MLLELAFIAQSLNDCQKQVEPRLLIGLLTNNPYQIMVMGKETASSPQTEGEAIDVINDLSMKSINFNAGMLKVHSTHFDSVGLTNNTAFDVCANIQAGATLLANCLEKHGSVDAAYSCYRSQNFLPANSKPMELSTADEKKYIKNQSPESTTKPKPAKVEAWDVFGDLSNN